MTAALNAPRVSQDLMRLPFLRYFTVLAEELLFGPAAAGDYAADFERHHEVPQG